MNTTEMKYEIWQCPDGEEALAFLERCCRIAYRSEDKIDDGKEACPACRGRKILFNKLEYDPCTECKGTGKIQARESSASKLLRSVLKADKRDRLVKMAAKLLTMNAVSVAQVAEDIVDNVLLSMQGDPPHESVLEHMVISVYFTGNRGFTHELVRHRPTSYTQESTRYCNYNKGKFGSEIRVIGREPEELGGDNPVAAQRMWDKCLDVVEETYRWLTTSGVKAQMARDVLPQVLAADIVCTANLRQWRHIFRMRCSRHAHPDMQTLMRPLLEELKQRIPIVFDDIYPNGYGDVSAKAA